MPGCVDTENWDNHSGRRCSDYALEQWCVAPIDDWVSGVSNWDPGTSNWVWVL